MSSNESDDEGFLNESEVLKRKEMIGYHQAQVQWMENGEKRNYDSIVVPPNIEQEKKNVSLVANPRFYAGLIMVAVALIFVAICRETFVSPPSVQELSPGIVSEDASRHKHKTDFPTMFPTHSSFPTIRPSHAYPTLVPTQLPSPTMLPTTEEVVAVLPVEKEPSMLPTELPSTATDGDASHPKKFLSTLPTMLPTQASLPTLLPTEAPIPTSIPTEAPSPTMVPTAVPSLPSATLHPSTVSVINHIIGGVTMVGLLLIGLLYGLYYWGYFGNTTRDEGYFIPLE